MIDLCFPIQGPSLPLDHGYPLFGAVSRLVPTLHDNSSWGIHPVHGASRDQRVLLLGPKSHLQLRLPAEATAAALTLIGAKLNVVGHEVTVGAPRIWVLRSAAVLQARNVVVASVIDPKSPEEKQRADLAASVRRKLAHLSLGMDPERVEVTIGRRHVMRIGAPRERQRGGKAVTDADIVVGFQVILSGLEAEASLAVQSQGIGGRRHMGCGIFVPAPRVVVA